jgi:tRNA uridine 5-carboxymethylaminomethyl modification enzyme
MFKLPTEYDVAVVGSGHAGIEAALAAARIGCRTLMLTQNLDTIGQMSCNPAIGGLAKGHIVREIDAMGGAMGLNADATGIQFRMLNRTKGPSVRAPRVQCDKKAYQFRMKAVLEWTENLDLKQATVSAVVVESGKAVGVETDLGLRIAARSVVITSGTFLRGLLHVGENSKPGGRMADASSTLSENLGQLGFQVGRFKTGTPCRLNARSIDFSRCEIQLGDEPPPRFAFHHEGIGRDANDVFTLNYSHRGEFHVNKSLAGSPPRCRERMKSFGRILPGRRSIPVKSKARARDIAHRLRTRSLDSSTKLSSTFPRTGRRHTGEYYERNFDQFAIRRSACFSSLYSGTRARRDHAPGLCCEYDYFPPTQLFPPWKLSQSAGSTSRQVNGTSGYEEAAAKA